MSGLYGFTTPLWPIRYKPLPDELLSSWLVRLAHGHGLKVQTFCNRLFGNKRQVWNRDMDRLAPDWLLGALATHTGTPIERVYQTTLRRYEGFLYPRFRSSGHLHWVQVMQMYHRTRGGYGQQYCTFCLAADSVPYFRTRWRLSLVTICTEHDCLLRDRCHHCSAPVSFHRIDTGMVLDPTRDLATCFKCGHDLAEGPSPNEILSDDPTFQWVKAMVWRIEAYSLGHDELQHHGVLAVLRHLIYLMLSSSQSISLNEYIAAKMDSFALNIGSGKRTLFESLPLHDRHQLIMQAAWMMDDLESRLFSAWKDRAVRYNHLLRDFCNAPEWYRTMVDKIPHSMRGGPRPQSIADRF